MNCKFKRVMSGTMLINIHRLSYLFNGSTIRVTRAKRIVTRQLERMFRARPSAWRKCGKHENLM
jgi:ligand-binding SRPBCC domain-containing protein